MANRVSGQEVKDIMDTVLSADDMAEFITVGNLMTTEICGGEGYSDELMKEIERWLSAHFAAIRDPRVMKEKIGDAEATYHGKSDMGLAHTPYGQQAMQIDFHGKLAAVQAAKGPAEVKAIA